MSQFPVAICLLLPVRTIPCWTVSYSGIGQRAQRTSLEHATTQSRVAEGTWRATVHWRPLLYRDCLAGSERSQCGDPWESMTLKIWTACNWHWPCSGTHRKEDAALCQNSAVRSRSATWPWQLAHKWYSIVRRVTMSGSRFAISKAHSEFLLRWATIPASTIHWKINSSENDLSFCKK